MAWDFETEPEFQRELDWMDAFVRDEVEPLDLVLGSPYDKSDEKAMAIVKPAPGAGEGARALGLPPRAPSSAARATASSSSAS